MDNSQEEIAEKMGWDRTTITKDLDDVKNGRNAENHVPNPLRFADVWSFSECIEALRYYLQCHTQEEIAEKMGWSRQIIGQDLDDAKNGKSAENGKPDPLRFADVWSFSECIEALRYYLQCHTQVEVREIFVFTLNNTSHFVKTPKLKI